VRRARERGTGHSDSTRSALVIDESGWGYVSVVITDEALLDRLITFQGLTNDSWVPPVHTRDNWYVPVSTVSPSRQSGMPPHREQGLGDRLRPKA